MKHAVEQIIKSLKLKYVYMWRGGGIATLNPTPFQYFTYINEIFKIVIQFKTLDQNIHSYLDKTLCGKQQI